MYPFVMLLVIGVCGYLVYLALKEEVIKETMERKVSDADLKQKTADLKDELAEKIKKMRGEKDD